MPPDAPIAIRGVKVLHAMRYLQPNLRNPTNARISRPHRTQLRLNRTRLQKLQRCCQKVLQRPDLDDQQYARRPATQSLVQRVYRIEVIDTILFNLMRTIDLLDLDSVDGLSLDIWHEIRDDLSDALPIQESVLPFFIASPCFKAFQLRRKTG